jgi:hypothetical protein
MTSSSKLVQNVHLVEQSLVEFNNVLRGLEFME